MNGKLMKEFPFKKMLRVLCFVLFLVHYTALNMLDAISWWKKKKENLKT